MPLDELKARPKVPKSVHLARRRATLKKAYNKAWLTEFDLFAIEEIYSVSKLRTEMTNIQHHVDHVVHDLNPIQG